MRLHVCTACSRPENLDRVAASLALWGQADYTWHIRFDIERRHVGGQRLKNELLNDVSEGWVWFLDDDTLAHPKLYRTLEQKSRGYDAIVVSQRRRERANLIAAEENVRVNEIDIGQAIIRRSLIGEDRIPETYAGDGLFLEEVLPFGKVLYLPEVLSFHNALSH